MFVFGMWVIQTLTWQANMITMTLLVILLPNIRGEASKFDVTMHYGCLFVGCLGLSGWAHYWHWAWYGNRGGSASISRYKRVFSIGSKAITTYNPTTFEVTNQVGFVDLVVHCIEIAIK